MVPGRNAIAIAAVVVAAVAALGCAHAPPARPPPERAVVVCVCLHAPGGKDCVDPAGDPRAPGRAFSAAVLEALRRLGVAATAAPPTACGGGDGPLVALFGNLRARDGAEVVDAHLALIPGPTPEEPVGSLEVPIRGRVVSADLDTRAIDLGQYALGDGSLAREAAPGWFAAYAAGVAAYLDARHGQPARSAAALEHLRRWEYDAGPAAATAAIAFARQLRALLLFQSSCDEQEDPVLLLRSARDLVPSSADARKLVAVAALSRAYGAAPVCARSLEHELLASTLISPWDDGTSKNLGSLYDLMSELPPSRFMPGQEIALETAVARRQMVPPGDRPERPNGFELATGVGAQHAFGDGEQVAAVPLLRLEASFGRRLSGVGVALGLTYATANQELLFADGEPGSALWSRQVLSAGVRRRWELPSGKALPSFFELRADGLVAMANVEAKDFDTPDTPSHSFDGGVDLAARFSLRRWGAGIWLEPSAAMWFRKQTVIVVNDGVVEPGPALSRFTVSAMGGLYMTLGD